MLLSTAAAHATAPQCRATIVKANAAFVSARAKALGRCEDAKVHAKLPAETVCATEARTVAALDKARAKLGATIPKGCGGKDRICGGINATDDDPLADVGWAIGTCPDFESNGCTNAITSCSDIPVCLACIGQAAVDRTVSLAYGAFQASTPTSTDKTVRALNKCQTAIGRSTTALLTTRAAALARCWSAVNKAGGGSCPDAAAVSAIGKAQTKLTTTIGRACSGVDKKTGTADDFTPSAIGFAAKCPSRTPVGQASCAATVDAQAALSSCVGCVGSFAGDCADRAAVPGFTDYPGPCNPPPPLPECTAQRAVYLVGGNGGVAWFTQVWAVPYVITNSNAAYSYDDISKAAAVPGTVSGHPLYARRIGSRTLWAGIGTHPDPSIFVAGTNETHTTVPLSPTTLSGKNIIAAGAALQGGLAAPVPALSLLSSSYGTAPNAPTPIQAASVDAAIAAIVSAASLTPAQQADLTPSDTTLAAWGITGSTSPALVTLARSLLLTANAFRMGLIATVAMPAFNDDPHGAFANLPPTTARIDGLTAVLDGFYTELAAHEERVCTHNDNAISLADNTMLVVYGDTIKTPFNSAGWGDGTPGNSNLLYVRANGWLTPGWFGSITPTARNNFDPTTGAETTSGQSASTAAAQLGVLFALTRGNTDAVTALSSLPYGAVVASTLP